jgi:hypothetical protein
MRSKSESYKSLDEFCTTVDIPSPVITENAGEEYGMGWQRVIK